MGCQLLSDKYRYFFDIRANPSDIFNFLLYNNWLNRLKLIFLLHNSLVMNKF